MNLTLVDVGVAPNDGTGDNIREAFIKVNQNAQIIDTLLYDNTLFGNATITELVSQNITATNTIHVSGNQESTSPASGALIVDQGLGVGANVHIGGNLYGTNGAFSEDLLVQGNLTVEGTLTTINSATLDVTDLNITVAKNATTAAEANGAGLTVAGANATMLYTSSNDRWTFNKALASGQAYITSITGTLQTNAQPNITSVGTLNGLSVAGSAALGNTLATSVTTSNVQVTGGAINGTVIGANDPRNGTFANLVAINGVTGTLQTAAQPNITSVGLLTGLTVNGTITANQLNIPGGATANVSVIVTGNAQITGGNITNTPISGSTGSFTTLGATTGNITTLNSTTGTITTLNSTTINGTNFYGAVRTSAQPYITSVGTLTSLTTSGNATIGTDLVVGGNLTVQGTSTTLNVNSLDVEDLNITVAKGAGTAAAANGAGITVDGANATFTYTSADDRWNLNKNLNVGTVYGNLTGTVQTAAQPNITSLGTLSSLGVSNNITTSSGNIAISTSSKGIVFGDGSFQTTKYVLPTASDTVLGGVKVGSGLLINSGVLSVNTSGGSQSFTDLVVTGNLTVQGSTTSINSTVIELADLNLVLAKNATTAGAASGAGITINGANATLVYDAASDRWQMNKNLTVGTVYGALSGNASTASTLQTARTIGINGDATWSVLFNGGASTTSALTLANSGVTAGTYNSSGAHSITVDAKGRVTSISNVTAPTFDSITHSGTDGVGDIGATGNRFGTIYGTATTALYADLAEKYESDREYPPGTVVVFGGSKEITQSTMYADVSIAGVVSTAPAYVMNDGINGLPIALRGKVPVRVVGPVKKGDLLVSGYTAGTAVSIGKRTIPYAVVGKALEDSNVPGEKLIYAVII